MIVDIPHKLGAAEARRRIEKGSGGVTRMLPSGSKVEQGWQGDQLNMAVSAMGQQVSAKVDVQEASVRVTLDLPPSLAFFGQMIEAGIRRGGAELLEDKR